MLPEYMMPSTFVHLNAFPLTSNGKIDRKALPAPTFERSLLEQVLPKTPLEQQLVVLWQNVLGLKSIGVHDDFFRIGGDSILSIQLIAKLRQNDIHCQVKDIFTHRTIAALARNLSKAEPFTKTQAEQGALKGAFALLPIQRWFFESMQSSKSTHYQHWNQAFIIKVPALEVQQLQEWLTTLMNHHDLLRATFKAGKQHYHAHSPTPIIQILDVSHLTQEATAQQLTEWQAHFTIEQGPLWSVGYLSGYPDKTARLHFSFHHLIIDAVSWRIIRDDIERFAEGKLLGQKTSSYRQWVHAVDDYAKTHPEERALWEKCLPSYLIIRTPHRLNPLSMRTCNVTLKQHTPYCMKSMGLIIPKSTTSSSQHLPIP